MWPFNNEPRECDKPDGEYRHYHEGPFTPRDDFGKWQGDFDPIAHDEEYVYGYVEKNPYGVCHHCGNRVKVTNVLIDRDFEKIPKDEVAEADLEQIEVTLDKLKLR